MHVYLFQYKIIKEGLSFVPDISFPLRLVGFFFFLSFPCSPQGLCSSSAFHGIQGTLLPPSVAVHWSRTCWSGGHASPLRKAGAWRHCSTLIACQNTHRSEKRQVGKDEKGPRGAQRGPKVVQLIPTVIQLWLIRLNLK